MDQLNSAERGPEQNGVFALWLFLRAASGVLPPAPLSERSHRRRLAGLERRLSSLSLPVPLRRAIAGSLHELAGSTPRAAALALQQLVAPARETVGSAAADAVASAARALRDAARESSGPA